MRRLGLCMENVKAIFGSHEHADHITGIPVLAKKYRLPVYITDPTRRQGRLALDRELVFPFMAYAPVAVGGLSVTAFPKFHDACDPHSFIVTSASVTVGIFTDIGIPCEHVIRNFRQCHAAFLEANSDEAMLLNGRYPYVLKQRIRGGRGHLSNTQALQLVTAHKPAFMSHLLLSHLSKNNNCPRLVHDLFSSHANGTRVVVASRYEETPVYTISNNARNAGVPGSNIYPKPRPVQLSLF